MFESNGKNKVNKNPPNPYSIVYPFKYCVFPIATATNTFNV